MAQPNMFGGLGAAKPAGANPFTAGAAKGPAQPNVVGAIGAAGGAKPAANAFGAAKPEAPAKPPGGSFGGAAPAKPVGGFPGLAKAPAPALGGGAFKAGPPPVAAGGGGGPAVALAKPAPVVVPKPFDCFENHSLDLYTKFHSVFQTVTDLENQCYQPEDIEEVRPLWLSPCCAPCSFLLAVY